MALPPTPTPCPQHPPRAGFCITAPTPNTGMCIPPYCCTLLLPSASPYPLLPSAPPPALSPPCPVGQERPSSAHGANLGSRPARPRTALAGPSSYSTSTLAPYSLSPAPYSLPPSPPHYRPRPRPLRSSAATTPPPCLRWVGAAGSSRPWCSLPPRHAGCSARG